jgi:predicted enzyme related to lactoylglutathione lyase
LIAQDWRSLAHFYEEVFGCRPVPPERDLRGPRIDAGTGIAGAHIRGIHLALPGYPGEMPTLEIFQYDDEEAKLPPAPNRPGYGHIAFAVEDVARAREAVVAAGGRLIGEMVSAEIADGRTITWAYVTDPEGNIIELQRSS